MYEGGVRNILLLLLVARCMETIDLCTWRLFVFMSVVVTVTVGGCLWKVCYVSAVVLSLRVLICCMFV